MEYCCVHGHRHYPYRHYGPGWTNYEEPSQDRLEFLKREKEFLQQRLGEVESRLAETEAKPPTRRGGSR